MKNSISFWLTSITVFWMLNLQAGTLPSMASKKTKVTQDIVNEPANEIAQKKEITRLLNMDRFLYFKDLWLDAQRKKKSAPIVQAIQEISFPEVLKYENELQDLLSDANRYNEALLKILKLRPINQLGIDATKLALKDVAWEYPFLMKKLNQSFLLQKEKFEILPGLIANIPARTQVQGQIPIPQLPPSPILLNVDQYIANRTTKGIFWDIILNNRPAEFHLGTERAFRTRLQAHKGRVLAEVKTSASNYNKIYVVSYPDQEKFTYAFTRISGADRLNHLVNQIAIIRDQLKNQGMINPPTNQSSSGQVKIYGSVERIRGQIEHSLVSILERLPRADLVIIGQKGGIEKVISGAYLLENLIQLKKDHADNLAKVLTTKELKTLENILSSLQKTTGFFDELKILEQADPLLDKLTPLFEELLAIKPGQEKSFNIEIVSHDISDILLKDKKGALRRWRLISNVWGDEARPIGRALALTGHQRVISIGTAGALKGKNIQVGDLVEAKALHLSNQGSIPFGEEVFKISTFDVKTSLPGLPTKGQKPLPLVVKSGTVGQVTTPFEETKDWFEKHKNLIDIVEIETGYLSEALRNKAKYQAFFLISDIVGSEEETLAEESSRKRKDTLLELLQEIFVQDGIQSVIPGYASPEFKRSGKFTDVLNLRSLIQKLDPNRSLESRYQIEQLALSRGLSSKVEIQNLLNSEESFTLENVQRSLTLTGHVLSIIAETMQSQGVPVRFYLPADFMEGRWNALSPLEIMIQADHDTGQTQLDSEIARIIKIVGPSAKKEFTLHTTIKNPEETWKKGVIPTPESSHSLMDIYGQIALIRGALFPIINQSGKVRFSQIPELTLDLETLPQHPKRTRKKRANFRCEQIFSETGN